MGIRDLKFRIWNWKFEIGNGSFVPQDKLGNVTSLGVVARLVFGIFYGGFERSVVRVSEF